MEGDEPDPILVAHGHAAAESTTTVSSTSGAVDLESWKGGGQGELEKGEEPPRRPAAGRRPAVPRESTCFC
jgi:hypothetical protein